MSAGLDNRRNFGIAAHVDAGKTTLTERILFKAKKIRRMGEVHQGESQMDWMKQEKERGITVQSAITSFDWVHGKRDFSMHLIDTPGHVDFTMEVQRSMRVLDGAILLLDGVAGVEPQTKTVWSQAERQSVPVIMVVNKLDRSGANFERCLESLKTNFGNNFIPILMPSSDDFSILYDLIDRKTISHKGDLNADIVISDGIPGTYEKHRDRLVDAIALEDEALFERSLSGEEISPEELKSSLAASVYGRKLFPVMAASALKNVGIESILNAICDLMPSPSDIAPKEETMDISRGLVFKIQNVPGMGIVNYIRVYDGTFRPNSYVYLNSSGNKYRIGRIMKTHVISFYDVKEASSGDLVAIAGDLSAITGDTMSSIAKCEPLEQIEIPEPVVSVSVKPVRETSTEIEKMSEAIKSISVQDPTIRFEQRLVGNIKHFTLRGMGELHLQIVQESLKEYYGVSIVMGKPSVEYRSGLTKKANVDYVFKRQTGGSGLWARVILNIYPLEEGSSEIKFENKVTGGDIPNDLIPSVEEGILYESKFGIDEYPSLMGYRVELIGGATHPVDSKKKAFELAGRYAIRELAKDNMHILEPYMKLYIVCSAEHNGKIIGDISQRRGSVLETIQKAINSEIIASIPLASLFGYVDSLRSMTSGNATAYYEFDRYYKAPSHLITDILKIKEI